MIGLVFALIVVVAVLGGGLLAVAAVVAFLRLLVQWMGLQR